MATRRPVEIRPTFDCFTDAIELMGTFVREDRQPTLVHGILESTSGESYAHAWVEADGYVWDQGLIDGVRVAYSSPQLDFYAARRVIRTWRYAAIEMLRENRRYRHYGPWVPELRELCSRSAGRILGSIPATYIP